MGTLVFDSETLLIQPGLLAPPLVCVSFCRPGEAPDLKAREEGADIVEAALDAGEILVGANIAYDFAVLCAYRPALLPKVFEAYRTNRVRDVQIRQKLLDIAAGELRFHEDDEGNAVKSEYSLKHLAQRLCGIDLSKGEDTWRLRYVELYHDPVESWPKAARDYALTDAAVTMGVFQAQPENVRNEPESVYAAWALHLASVWGVRTERAAVDKLRNTIEGARSGLVETIKAAGFYKAKRATKEQVERGKVDFWEPSKRKGEDRRPMVWSKDMSAIRSVVEGAFKTRGEGVPLTDSGQTATEKDVLLRAGDERLEALAELSGLDKIRDTYLPILEAGTDVPINARFNVLVASGRTSCSKPNLQNMPGGSKIGGTREVFVARPGTVWVSVDYDTLELRALAQVLLELFGRSRMADVLCSGRDLHIDMGAQILGISYEEFVARRKAGDKAVKKARDYAKIVNFGLPGGLGAETLISYARKSPAKIVITFDEARELIAKYRNAWPEMNEFFAYAGRSVGNGHATFSDPVTGFVRGGVGYCEFCNSHFQHRAAWGAKAAVSQISYECYVDTSSALYGARLVNFVHDECIIEVEETRAHEAAERLAAVMVARMSDYIKNIPITASPALMTRWSKEASEVRDAAGRLIPWTPKQEKAA